MAISTIDTATVADADRLEFWRSTVCDQFVPLDVDPLESRMSRARVHATTVGDTLIRRIEGGPHRFHRTSTLVRRADEDYLQIAVARQGTTLVAQDGREAVIGPGDLVIYDSARPFVFETSGPFAYSVCLYPTRLLPLTRSEMTRVTAIRFDGRYGVAAMVPPFLSALHRLDGDALVGPAAEAMTQSVGDLLVALVRSVPPQQQESTTHLHLDRARTYIAFHLADPDLAPPQIAAACAISTSYLHRLFRASGTSVVEYLREQRLQRCWRALGEPGDVSIGAVAARHGLPDHAHFCRIFRARFGMTPSQRRAAATGSPVMEPSAPRSLE